MEVLDFGDAMGVCDKQDCKRRYFSRETFRWFKRALNDIGIVIHDNPKASAALFIGVSVLIANIYTGGALIPMTLKAIGFGSQGPISGSIASFIQANMGSINAGSIFAQLQSAAMGGATLAQLQQMATVAFAGLGAAGGSGLLGAGLRSFGQNADFGPAEWRAWESESRIPYSVELVNKMPQMWKPVTAETCVAYGYREYRAAIWFVPEGEDPLEVCLRTSAIIKGVGFKTPLACADQGPKKGVIGTWYVQSNETRCMPQWSNFEDEGCMQYGRRRHFSRLMGLRHQDDWNSLCESTPAHINGEEFGAPTYCENKGIRGIYGIFDIPDEKCECYCRAT
ncbi:interferon-induced 6-16 family protein [Ceratobasidium sp. AG-Ba]|nr:interferon-induced 6-16 family protein [Ceratobasidium sp. AG-Ba]